MKTFFRRIAEMVVPNWTGGLRSWFQMSGQLWSRTPLFDKTGINYDLARQLYRNDGEDVFLGGGFCRPIIDRAVEFMGLPSVDVGDDNLNDELNDAIHKQWAPVLQEMFRNAMRDSKTVVRMWQPPLTPLITEEERNACRITVVDPERVTLIYDPQNPDILTKAVIVYDVDFSDPEIDISPGGDPRRGQKPQTKVHEIWEVVTVDFFRYYDRTDAQWLTDWQRDNVYGFVPLHEVWNEWDSALSGGQSDLEAVYPFVKAFHEVLLQSLKAHKYHSSPKLQLGVEDVSLFLQNNFPDTIDETTGKIKQGSKIKWEGREIIITSVEDKIAYLEAKSVLGDSKTLLEFLVDCIAVAAEMPEEFFMRTEQGAAATGSSRVTAFEKKIERKRKSFQDDIQMLCKMHEALNNRRPLRPEVFWEEQSVETLASMAQAMQQVVMSLEVLLQRQLVSDDTAREMLRTVFSRIFRKMKSSSQEAKDAAGNLDLSPVLPAAPLPADTATKNGKGSKKAASSALSTTRAGGGKNE